MVINILPHSFRFGRFTSPKDLIRICYRTATTTDSLNFSFWYLNNDCYYRSRNPQNCQNRDQEG